MRKMSRTEYLKKRNEWIYGRFLSLKEEGLKTRRVYRQISLELDGELSPRGVQKVILGAKKQNTRKNPVP